MASRGSFSGRIGFVAAAAGSAVGLGNIWQFPYVAGVNGGGAFLIVYVFWIFVIGLPIMVGEIALGRHTKMNPFGAYRALGGKAWGLVGILGILCATMILTFYNVVSGWAFGYFLETVKGTLLEKENYSSFFQGYVSDISNNFFFSLIFMVITAFIVMQGIKKGIEGTAKVLMPTLLVILILISIYGLTLPGAMEGVRFYIFPDFSQINGSVIYAALGQAFFSLSLGLGGLITYGSYVSKKENIVGSAAMVTVTDSIVAFLAGMMIFPLVFAMGQSPSEGPGLVFVALPAIFQAMGPVLGTIVGALFFLLLCFAALTSTISLLEIPVAYLRDEHKFSRKKSVIIMATIIFLLGLPSMLSFGTVEVFTNFVYYQGQSKSFMDLITDIFSVIALPLGGFLMSLFIATRWKTKNLSAEITQGYSGYAGSVIEKILNFIMVYVAPLALGLMFVLTVLEKFFGIQLL